MLLMSEGVGHFATLKEVDWKLEPVELIRSESWKYFGTLKSNFDRKLEPVEFIGSEGLGGDDRLLH